MRFEQPHWTGAAVWPRRMVSAALVPLLVATLVTVPSLPARAATSAASAATASEPALMAREVRTIHTSTYGVERPGGVAWSPETGFVVAQSDDDTTAVARLGVGDEGLGTLDVDGTAGIDPATLTVTATGDALVAVAGDALVEVATADLARRGASAARVPLAAEVAEPAGATLDGDGALVVLDAATGDLVPADGDGAPVNLPVSGDLRGLAHHPGDGLLYVLDADADRLYGVDTDGRLRRTYDLGDVGLRDPQDLVFAPSSDTTDAEDAHNLFVADAGDAASLGGVVEVTLVQVAAADVPVVTARLVQTIDTSRWVPASPDPSGVTYLPASDRLTVVDSEVDEQTGAGYHGVNVWEVTRHGEVVRGWNTLAFTNEPTGVGHDPATNTLFISTDSGTAGIHVVQAGPDGLFGTGDDQRRFLNTAALGLRDTEDPEFDPATGHLFFLDGVSTQVFRVDPVNGVFGDADDVITSFDVGRHGATDAEGLASDRSRGTLLVGDRRTRQVYEVEKTGELVRIIDARTPEMTFLSGMSMAPATDAAGRDNLWIVDRAVDNGADPNENDGKLFELSLQATGNRPPVINAITVAPTGPGTNDVLTATVQASDADGDPVTLGYQWRRDGVDLPGRTGRTLDLSQPGNGDRGDEIAVRVTASDGQGQDVRTSTPVRVRNSAPTFDTPLPDRTDREGATVDLAAAASDVDGDRLRFVATGLPPGVSIDAATGRITGTVAAGAAGASPYAVAVTVHDDGAAPPNEEPPPAIARVQHQAVDDTAVSSLTATFAAPPTAGNLLIGVGHYAANRVPSIPVGWSLAYETNTAGETVVFYRVAQGGEPPEVTFGASGAPLFMSLAVFEYAGMHDVQAEVLDRFVTAAGTAVNEVATGVTPPTSHPDDLLLATVGLNATRTFAGAWTNGFASVTATRRQAVAQRVVTERGEFTTSESWTGGTVNTAVGSLAAFKGAAGMAAPGGPPDPASTTTRFTWTVTAPAPEAPVVTDVTVSPTQPRTADVLTASATVTGPQPATLRYQWLRDGTPLAGRTGRTLDLGVAGNGDKGDRLSVRVVAEAGGVASAPATSTPVTVVNSPPAISATPTNRSDPAGATVGLTLAATDADGDALTWAATGLPAGLSIEAATGRIAGTIAAGAVGTHRVGVTVGDGEAPPIAAAFTWTVTTPSGGPGGPGQPPSPFDAACPAGRVPSAGFVDVGPGAHRAAIDCVAWHGLFEGFGDGTFGPRQEVTRAQFASAVERLVRAAGADLPATGERFPDVPAGSTHADAIGRLAAVGIIEGHPDGTFRPRAPIERAQAASLMVRMHAYATGDALPPGDDAFRDDDGNVHEAAIDAAARAGWILGLEPGVFAPREHITRDQVASVIARAAGTWVLGGHLDLPAD